VCDHQFYNFFSFFFWGNEMATNEADIILLNECLKTQHADPFIKRYTPVIKNTIYSMARKRNRELSEWDLEDLIQTALLELFITDWKRLKNYDSTRGMTLTSWVVLLTQHAVWDFFNELPDNPLPDNKSDQEDTDQTPEDKIIDKESAFLYLESLTDIERLIVKMRYFENLEIEDIAHVIHRSESRVYQLLKQAREKLPEQFQKESSIFSRIN